MGKEKKHKEYKPDKREKYEELPVSRPAGLKLVLKVGGSPVPECSEPRAETPPAVAPLRLSMAAISEAETQHKERKHKKKKKKEKEKHKHKKERRLLEELDQDQEMSPGPETGGRESRQSSGTEEAPSQGTVSSPEPCRPLSPPAGTSASADTDTEPPQPGLEEGEEEEGPPALRRFLEHLLRGLQEKDTRGFFSIPVTDDVAPGYSSIIDSPMDFSTMAQKVRDGQYPALAAFKEDFRLMCCNAMTYNSMDTIYYRTAKRLLDTGSKMMSSDKVIALRSMLPGMTSLSPEVLGVEASDLRHQDERQQHQLQQQQQQEVPPPLPPQQEEEAQPPPPQQQQQQQSVVEKMEVDSEVPDETPSPVAVETSPGPVAPEVLPEPEPEVLTADSRPSSAAAGRQTRRQARGVVETPPAPPPEPAEGRPSRQSRTAERPEPEAPRQTRQGRLTEPRAEPADSRLTRQVRGQEQPKLETEGRQTRQARTTEPSAGGSEPQVMERDGGQSGEEAPPVARSPEPEPEIRQTRRGSVGQLQRAAVAAAGPSPPPSGPARAAQPEPMDTSENTEPSTSTLIMKQPHLVLEKIDAEPGMRQRRDWSRLLKTVPTPTEEPAAAPAQADPQPSTSSQQQPIPRQPQQQPQSEQQQQQPQSGQQQQPQSEQQQQQPVKAKKAADLAGTSAVQKQAPSSKLGFLRRRVDGTTSLTIVTGAGGGGERHEQVATVGGMTGRLQQGATHLPTFRDDKRNQAKPVKPLYYGAYSSFAPSYDSTFATISHAESELLFETLSGGQSDCGGQQLAHSVRQAADDCDIAIDMVDSLLDVLTDGQHRRQEQRRRLAAPAPAPAPAPVTAAASHATTNAVDFASLRSLGELGIDVGFLDVFEAEDRRVQETQSRLDRTGELLGSLNTTQLRRLSLPPETGLPPPSQQELQLAEDVSGGLADLVKRARPGQVASQAAVRKAMGVGLLPPGQALVRPAAAPAPAPVRRPPPASGTSTAAHPSLRTLLSRM